MIEGTCLRNLVLVYISILDTKNGMKPGYLFQNGIFCIHHIK